MLVSVTELTINLPRVDVGRVIVWVFSQHLQFEVRGKQLGIPLHSEIEMSVKQNRSEADFSFKAFNTAAFQ